MHPLAALAPVLLPFLVQGHGAGPEPREAPVSTALPASGVELPLLDFGGRPAVDVEVAGATLRVLVDTGSTLGLALSPAAVERLDLEPDGTTDLGPGAAAPRFRVPELRLGDALLEDVPATELDFLARLAGCDGIIGFPCFAECLLTLDFAGARLRLDVGALESGADTIPFRRDEVLGFDVTVDVDVGGVSVPVHLDTGSPTLATFSGQVRPELVFEGELRPVGRARTPMGDADILSGRLSGAMRLGPLVHDGAEVRVADLPQIAGRRLGNIGAPFFRGASLTLDARHGLLAVRLPQAPAAPEDVPR